MTAPENPWSSPSRCQFEIFVSVLHSLLESPFIKIMKPVKGCYVLMEDLLVLKDTQEVGTIAFPSSGFLHRASLYITSREWLNIEWCKRPIVKARMETHQSSYRGFPISVLSFTNIAGYGTCCICQIPLAIAKPRSNGKMTTVYTQRSDH